MNEAWLRLAMWLCGTWLLWRIPDFAGRSGTEGGPADSEVSIIIPARDEEARLPRLLRSLASQDPPPAEVIVVDDSSRDQTAAIAAAAGCTVVQAGPLPPGWNGKPWACWQGAQRARSPLLLFLDADTELEDNGLARIVEEYRRERGPLSVQPWHAMERPFEQLSAFFNIVLMMGTHVFTPLGRRLAPRAFFGPCQVMSRQEYQAVGGHQAVKGSVLEDLALGRAFAAAGLPVRCMGGRGAIRFRMYGGGVRELVEGWSKGFAAGAGSTGLVPLLLTVLWVSGAAGSTVSLLQAALNGQPLLQPLAFYLLFGLQVYWMLARIGSFSPLQVVLFPLPLLFFVLVFARALVVTYGLKRVKWKGRVISTRGK